MPFQNDKSTKQRYFPGYCFICFETSDEAARAVQAFEKKVPGAKALTVKISSSSSKNIRKEHYVDDLYKMKNLKEEIRSLEKSDRKKLKDWIEAEFSE